MTSSSILEVFLTEAITALASLEDRRTGDAVAAKIIAELRDAAELVGDDALVEEVSAIAAMSAADRAGACAALGETVARLGELVPTGSSPTASDRESADPAAATSAARSADSSTTQVRKRARKRRSSKFDTAEHQTLLSFFRDEAFEALEQVTMILGGASERPDDEVLAELMRTTHTVKGAAGTVDLPAIADITHRLESALENTRTGSLSWTPAVRETLVDITDGLRALIARAEDDDAVERSSAKLRRQLTALTGGVVRAETGDDGDTEAAPAQGGSPSQERRTGERRGAQTPVLRVDPARVDRLMDSVGELVFDRTRIERRVNEILQLIREVGDTGDQGELGPAAAERVAVLEQAARSLIDDTRALRRTERALQDGLTGVRMQVARALFTRLAPQVRQIARDTGKQVRLVTSGGETEFDKSVADQITDPLLQLLRNAIAHGAEATPIRTAQGKDELTRITLSARHEGAMVVLEVSDDGAGIDPDALRDLFVTSGRWTRARARLASDQEVLATLFEAGVTSRDEADQLAGRGVGLSAVQETVTRLGGEVLVSSTSGKGTRFSMRLPLTTAVTNALLFKVGGHVFAVPNVHVVDTGTVTFRAGSLPSHLAVRDTPVPLIPLHTLLGFDPPEGVEHISTVAIEYAGKRLAMTVDKIVGPREIVVKNLGPLVAPIPLYAGGTISGSGKVQLILDPATLVRVARLEAPGERIAAPGPAAPTPRAHGSALVVDDSRAIRQAMLHLLERCGYRADAAADGAEAWEHLGSYDYDVLITDLEMPVMSGFELIERVRARHDTGGLPVIIISSRVDDANRSRARSLGVDSVLAKPVTEPQLTAALSQLGLPVGSKSAG